jgi:hypothetical protein
MSHYMHDADRGEPDGVSSAVLARKQEIPVIAQRMSSQICIRPREAKELAHPSWLTRQPKKKYRELRVSALTRECVETDRLHPRLDCCG